MHLFALLGALLGVASFSAAEPIQYCRFGHKDKQIDFCLGITTHHNHSTAQIDMYMTMSVTRSSTPDLGWTAVGTGSGMAGSLMFVVYGDPTTGSPPILSIRTASGHKQPHVVQKQEMGGADLRVLHTAWDPTPDTYTARAALVCYACGLWPGLALAGPAAASQPWIWAWNGKQRFDVYAFDAKLDMHAHHAGHGGWGAFFVDAARARSEDAGYPALPPLRPGVARLGTSDRPIGAAGVLAAARANPLPGLHAFCMVTAFLLLFPLGVVAVRSGLAETFRRHWLLQAAAMACTAVGIALGITMRVGDHTASSAHQGVGGATATLLVVQAAAGYRHHVLYVRIRQRTWVSHLHIWLGRVCLAGGWAAILSGLKTSGVGEGWILVVLCFMFFEAVGLGSWIVAFQRRTRRSNGMVPPGEFEDRLSEHFSIEDADDGDDTSEAYGEDKEQEVKGL